MKYSIFVKNEQKDKEKCNNTDSLGIKGILVIFLSIVKILVILGQ